MHAEDAGKTRDLCDDIRDVLEYYRALGIEGISVNLVPAPKGVPEKRAKPEPRSAVITGVKEELPSDKEGLLAGLRNEIGDCTRCKLSSHRKNIVFGEGSAVARLMFIGEAPGREEDIQSRPFVGEAGMLLSKLIERMGFSRKEVYIANIVKCRPPQNRDPEKDEVETCRGFIDRQIDIIRPEVIMTLGRIALQTLKDAPDLKITNVRGNFFDYKGIPVMPTFHPAYLMRNPKDKWLTWADAQKVMKKLGSDE